MSGRLAVGEFLLHAPCLNLIVGSGVSLTRPVLESDRRFRSLSYTSHAGICLVSSRVRSVCYTPDPKVCLCVLLQAPGWNQSRRSVDGESLLQTPYKNLLGHSSGGEFLLHAPCWNLSHCLALGEFVLHAP